MCVILFWKLSHRIFSFNQTIISKYRWIQASGAFKPSQPFCSAGSESKQEPLTHWAWASRSATWYWSDWEATNRPQTYWPEVQFVQGWPFICWIIFACVLKSDCRYFCMDDESGMQVAQGWVLMTTEMTLSSKNYKRRKRGETWWWNLPTSIQPSWVSLSCLPFKSSPMPLFDCRFLLMLWFQNMTQSVLRKPEHQKNPLNEAHTLSLYAAPGVVTIFCLLSLL